MASKLDHTLQCAHYPPVRIRFFASVILFFFTVVAANASVPPAGLESIEWCDIWIAHANETNLPRVLLIGDSITRDYYPGVEQRLQGKAYVGRLSSSAFISDPALLKQIAMVLGEYHFDIIHFNNGMHGWQHSEKEYEQGFPKLLRTIQGHAPKAKFIWATTTPLKVSPSNGQANEATDLRIEQRNAFARNYLQKKSIPVDDLYALMRGHPEYHSDNVHFNSQGVELQATQVAGQIEALLNAQ